MVWENNPRLRHPDGSPDIAAYGRIAHRERDAAVLAAVQEAARSLRAMWRSLTRSLAQSFGRSLDRSLGQPGRIRSNAPLRS